MGGLSQKHVGRLWRRSLLTAPTLATKSGITFQIALAWLRARRHENSMKAG
jgi:hypothetical protein